VTIARKPREIFCPDPLLGWRLTPDAQVRVQYRDDVVQQIGSDGWRVVPESDNRGGVQDDRPGISIHGCSFTYGTGLRDTETYAAIIQSELLQIRVLNRGIGGHSTVQNYLQFRRDVRQGQTAAAIFGVYSMHRYRNIPHPKRMHQFTKMDWYRIGVEHVPIARQDRSGALEIDYVPIWQPAMQRDDFEAFLPNDQMIDDATICVFEAIAKHAEAHGIPVLFALLDNRDRYFNARMLGTFSQTIDASVPRDTEHTFLPHDGHPNVLANQKYAAIMMPHITRMAEALG
jgi:hypothetical protein